MDGGWWLIAPAANVGHEMPSISWQELLRRADQDYVGEDQMTNSRAAGPGRANQKQEENPKALKAVRGVIMQDDVFSSLGKHNKGDVVELPEFDADVLEKNRFFVRV